MRDELKFIIPSGVGAHATEPAPTGASLNVTSCIAAKAVWSVATEKQGIKLRLRSYEQCNDDSTNKESNK
jgi:hypothetical protein